MTPGRSGLRRILGASPVAAILAVVPTILWAQSGAIAGRITDATTTRPLPGVRIELRAATPDSSLIAQTQTSADGRYLVAPVPSGRHTVVATILGYRPARRLDLAVRPNDTTDASLALEPLGTLLDPVVVSVSRTEEPSSRAPATVTVVEARTIEERPTVTPVEQARDAPGVDIAMAGIIQNHIVTRGFNGVFSGALLVLTDYRYDIVPSLRVNTPWLIPAVGSDIDRLEVVLGPAAALYGPNASAGVLHLFTKSPFDFTGTTVSAMGLLRSGNTYGGAGGGQQLTFRHAAMVGQKLAYKATAQYLSATDWVERDSVEMLARQESIRSGIDSTRVLIGRRRDDVSRWSAEATVELRPNESTQLTVSGGRTRAGSAVALTGIGAAQVRGWSYDYVQARLQRGQLFAQGFVNINNAGATYLLRSGNPIVDRSRMFVGQLQHGIELGALQTLTYGLDAQSTEPRTGRTISGRFEDDDRIDEIGGYVQSETHLTPRLDFIAAARVDRHNRLPSAVFSPRAAVVFRPNESQTIRLTYNRAFETPTAQNLFADLVASTDPGGLPLVVRSVGVPSSGFGFRHDCGAAFEGLCMRSPFAGAQAQAIDATRAWNGLVALLKASNTADLSGIPAPSAGQVGSVLRVADVSGASPRFQSITAADVHDIPALRPTITNALEAGYKGKLGESISLALDAYYESKENLIGPPQVITPSVFLETSSLAAYLGRYMSASQAQQVATLIGGVTGSAALPGIPVATVAPEGVLGGSPDVLVTYRNFGKLHRFGADVGARWTMSPRLTLTGAYSWVNKLLWPREEVGGIADVALNAPGNRATLALQLRDGDRGVSAYLRGRYSGSFPMNSGVYVGHVDAYTLADAGVAVRLPRRPDLLLTVTAQNLFNELHREFVGAAEVGRLVMVQLEYRLR